MTALPHSSEVVGLNSGLRVLLCGVCVWYFSFLPHSHSLQAVDRELFLELNHKKGSRVWRVKMNEMPIEILFVLLAETEMKGGFTSQ